MTRTSNETRRQFIEFFTARGHTVVPSSSLLPADDPTLLFANAGMNQFKDVFLGAGSRPYARAVNSQKCIRAGGKHNDLEDVGHDTYHHTFFEMLGNWSFGDYFKREAITWAWELLTGVWGLPKERLWATVFGGEASLGLAPDTEAEALWPSETGIPRERVLHGSAKDNFWEMGETGPCGPCTEIHFDRGEAACDGSRHPGRSCAVNVSGCGRFVELWNLVFIQFNRNEDGTLSSLPARHVDTGMGFERVCAVLQGKTDNYATDVFAPLMDWLAKRTGVRYGASTAANNAAVAPNGAGNPKSEIRNPKQTRSTKHEGKTASTAANDAAVAPSAATAPASETDVALRVIADHARACTFAIADGVMPSNDGRGYVVRRILRRAARFGRKLGLHEPFLHELAGVVADQLGDVFPEVAARRKQVAAIIKDEEVSFNRTLDRGLAQFQATLDWLITFYLNEQRPDVNWLVGDHGDQKLVVPRPGGRSEIADFPPGVNVKTVFDRLGIRSPVLPGNEAFELYATYGFPIDMIQQMAGERGLTVDMAGYEDEMQKHKEISAAGSGGFKAAAITGLPETDDSAKYAPGPLDAKVLGWVLGEQFVTEGELQTGAEAAVVLDRTNFYGEQGGQVGDAGTLSWPEGSFAVTDTKLVGHCVLHVGKVEQGPLTIGHKVVANVSAERMDTRRNHTATHLLNWALREVLGEGVDQAGSVVEPGRLRFDFTSAAAMSDEQIAETERLVNARVLADEPVAAETMPLAEAKKLPGVRAVFGERYPDPVRVIRVGHQSERQSAEFCGGTHLDRTGQVGFFKIVGEESVAKGVRRITAVTGREAVVTVQRTDRAARSAAAALRIPVEELPDRIAAMQKEIKDLRKEKAAKVITTAGNLVSGPASVAATATVGTLPAEIATPAGKVIVADIPTADAAVMRSFCDVQRQKGAVAVLVGGAEEGKVTLVAMVTEELVKGTGVKAGDWVKAAAAVMGGSGGGKPTMAQAGGKEPEKLPDALQAGREWMRERLGPGRAGSHSSQ